MKVTKQKTVSKGVIQIEFNVVVADKLVPCVLYAPNIGARSHKVLIGMAHGGSQHKKSLDLRMRAIDYAQTYGWVTFAVDAPEHGDRIDREEARRKARETAARVAGDKTVASLSRSDKIAFLDDLSREAVPEWMGALDTVLGSGLFDQTPSIGFWGISMGSTVGIPLLAADNRFRCAVLGLVELHPQHDELRRAANAVSVPLRFIIQWDDLIRDREYGVALYDAFGSAEKSMHINPGGHPDFPPSESDSWALFFQRHFAES